MNDEEKGFVIKDKRGSASSEKETLKEEGSQKEKISEKKIEKGNSLGKGDAHLPEINFATFILSLNSSAMLHFGDFEDPVSGKKEKNLTMAKQTIEMIDMLKEKTKGNLTPEEEMLLENILYELKIRYVKESNKSH